MSSSFSRISYGVHDDADPEEVKAVLEKNGDGIVGVLFGKSVGEQIGSTWFWLPRLLMERKRTLTIRAMEFMVVIQMYVPGRRGGSPVQIRTIY
jgi:hypothetical protein